MSNSRCGRTVLNLVTARADDAQARYTRAVCDQAGLQAANNAWDEANPEDGVGSISSNPYRSQMNSQSNTVARLSAEMDHARAVRTFVIEKITGLLKEDDEEQTDRRAGDE